MFEVSQQFRDWLNRYRHANVRVNSIPPVPVARDDSLRIVMMDTETVPDWVRLVQYAATPEKMRKMLDPAQPCVEDGRLVNRRPKLGSSAEYDMSDMITETNELAEKILRNLGVDLLADARRVGGSWKPVSIKLFRVWDGRLVPKTKEDKDGD